MTEAKPFCIIKRDVWEAYKQVKANKGAAGVDGQSIEDFEKDLSNNLYQVWNRMCSGSYFPPPVRRVDIPKGDEHTSELQSPCNLVCRLLLEKKKQQHTTEFQSLTNLVCRLLFEKKKVSGE